MTQKRSAKFEIYPDAKGEFRWRLRSANSRIIADSGEGYRTRAGARRAINTVMTEIRNFELPIEQK